MNKHPFRTVVVWTLCLLMVAPGCWRRRSFVFQSPDELEHYVDMATDLEAPLIEHHPLAEVTETLPPLTLEQVEQAEFWDISLQEAIRIALTNAKIVRQLNSRAAGFPTAGGPLVLPPPDGVLRQPDAVPTIYDPAIRETGVAGPGLGVEAALAAFDAQLSASMTWSRNERPVNVGGFGNFIFARDFQQDLGDFQVQLSKIGATGSQFFARHNVNYEWNNNPTRGVPSDYQVNVELGVNQPLLQGAGTLFNRIAGPSGAPGIYNGVLIARVQQDQSLADFEAAVRNMVSDVENAYWELYMAYRAFDAAKRARDDQLEGWRKVKVRAQQGAAQGDRATEAQARNQYYRFRAQLEDALRNLLKAENRLRYLMGLSPTDGRLLRPSDEPTTAKVTFDWYEVHQEALVRSPELRKQRWRVKQRELELIASRNFLLPRLDAVALYRVLGAGDTLINPNGRGVPPYAGSNAYATLTDGNYTEWQLGFNFSMPLGFRRELAAVRNAQLLLARERARLQEQELEVSHLLTDALRDLEYAYLLTETRFNNWIAAKDEVEAVTERWNQGVRGVIYNDVLAAQARYNDAEINYYRALVSYNKAIAAVHYHKGSLLEYNGIYLAEGPWPHKAYADAAREAARRAAATPIDYVLSRPRPFSAGPVNQQWHDDPGAGGREAVQPEPVPAPGEQQPQPKTQPEPPQPAPQQPAPKTDAPPVPQPTRPASPARQRQARETETGPRLLHSAAPVPHPHTDRPGQLQWKAKSSASLAPEGGHEVPASATRPATGQFAPVR